MTNSRVRCKRCPNKFEPAFAEQILCSRCRHQIIKQERRAAKREARRELTLAQLELTYDYTRRSEWDTLIIDENGRTVWAKDLARRYRNELDARQRKEYRITQRNAGVQGLLGSTTY